MISASIAIVCALIFLTLLFLLHFLKPELGPAWRMISEYEIGRFGWLMRLAFFAWGTSVLALLVRLWPVVPLLPRGWLGVIAIALFGAGIFKTDPITATTSNWVNRLHTLCGAAVILTFPSAASITVGSLLHNPAWSGAQPELIVGTVLVWVGMLAFFASIPISRALDPASGRVGPHIYLGWPNRFMVVTYVVWVVIVAIGALPH